MDKKRYTTLDDLPLTLRVEEVAAVLGVGRNTAYELIHSGSIPSIKVKTQIRIPKKGMIEFLQGNGKE